jgi:hypothetical protein
MERGRLSTNCDDTPSVAVCLQRNDPPHCNLHVGIVHRNGAGELRHLHFAWHRRLRSHKIESKLICAIPNYEEVAHRLWMATYCGLVARNIPKRSIPYNLRFDEGVLFDNETGEVRFGPESTGLTCATFVVAVFRSAGHPLVTSAGWPKAHAEDRHVQRELVEALRSDIRPSSVDAPQQAATIESQIGEARCRPEHVPGACLEPQWMRPIWHAPCDKNGKLVVESLDIYLAHGAPN